jgi:hypothetical protein
MYSKHSITQRADKHKKYVNNYLFQGEQLKRRTSEKLGDDLLPSATLDR